MPDVSQSLFPLRGPTASGHSFPRATSSSTWTFVLSQQSKLEHSSLSVPNCPHTQEGMCQEMDMKEKRWGLGGQQELDLKGLKGQNKEAGSNVVGF